MNYEITNKRLMEVMKEYMDETIEPINMPLVEKLIKGKGNKGYGSEMDDYTYINKHYLDEVTGKIIFREYSDNYRHRYTKWDVDEMLTPLYDFFDEEAFEEFVKYYFGLNIKNRGNKENNWLFV